MYLIITFIMYKKKLKTYQDVMFLQLIPQYFDTNLVKFWQCFPSCYVLGQHDLNWRQMKTFLSIYCYVRVK